MRRVVGVCVVGVLLCAGCSPFGMAKRGLTELRGATGKAVPIRDVSPSFAASLGSIQMGTVSNSIAPVCPPGMFTLLRGALERQTQAVSTDLSGSRSAVIDLDVSFYNPPGGALAVAGKAGLLIGRAKVKDDAGQEQGDVLIGVSSEAVRTTREEMADVFGQTLVGYLKDQAGRGGS
jgi:hypothetical protein